MGTAKKKTEEIEVMMLKQDYRINGAGRLGVHVRIQGRSEENDELLSRYRVGAIFVDSYGEYRDNRLFPLSEHLISLNLENGQIEFKEVLTRVPKVDRPKNCPSCNDPLVWNDDRDDAHCISPWCPGQSLTCLRKMIFEDLPLVRDCAVLNDFFEKYLIAGQPGEITNLFEFKTLFFEANKFDKKNALRRDQWLEKYPREGKTFWEIEKAFQERLSKKEQDARYFWHLCSFPYLDAKFSVSIPADFNRDGHWLNPQLVVDGAPEVKEWYQSLSDKSRALLETNHDFIKLLLETFNKRGPVTWT